MDRPFVHDDPSLKFLGILVQKLRWGLSWRGWLVSLSTILLAGFLLLMVVHPFLAVTHRVDARVLVVEGWIGEYGIAAASREFNTGRYQRIFITGGPVAGSGGYSNDYYTAASVGAGLLRAAGLPDKFIQMVPSHEWKRNRTYYSAVALKDWFHEHHLEVRSFNVVTESPHARRTWMLFQKAFGKDVQVGIISIPNPDYNPRYWWHYSDGVREVIGESVAYFYARVLFNPSTPARAGQ